MCIMIDMLDKYVWHMGQVANATFAHSHNNGEFVFQVYQNSI